MPRRTAPADPPADETPDDAGSPQPTAPTTTADPESDSTAGSPPPPPPPPPAAESGVFTWLRSIEITRRPGWLGGVCAGIAERIGIDPLIVRGIVVVLAVVGAPVALLYAIAWFLLPDENGIIHAQELGHGRVTRALPGIVAIFLLSFLPLTQGLWYTGALYWSNLDWGGAVVRAVWTGLVLVAGIVLVVWLARRASAEVPTTPATTDDRPETVPSFPASSGTETEADAEAEIAAAVAAAVAGASVAAPGEPPAPPADASAEELAAWKQSQAAWQQQRAAWAAEQKRSERDRRQAEAGIRAVAAAEAARERARIRKLTRPRARAGVVFLVLGLALVASAIAAFGASQAPSTRGAEWLIGAAVLVLVLGLGTVVVGLARRRSGALAFFSILSMFALVVAVVVPVDRTLLPIGTSFGLNTMSDGRYAQLAGQTSLYVRDQSRPVTIDLWQLAGSVDINLDENASLRLIYTTDAETGYIGVSDALGAGRRDAFYLVEDGRLVLVAGQPVDGETDLTLRLWAGRSTNVYITSAWGAESGLTLSPEPTGFTVYDEMGELVPTPTPTPTDVTTGGAP